MDWDREVVTCPAGKENDSRLPSTWPENSMVFEARFGTPVAKTRCSRFAAPQIAA